MANTLPPELLSKVFESISPFDNQRPTVISCLIVNQEWHDVALRFLYKDLVLFCGPQLDLFTACHNRRAVSSLTRSLTLYISRPGELPGSAFNEAQNRFLQLATHVIPRMNNLRSLSVARHHRVPFCWIKKSIVSIILRSIPPSCTSLELALGTSDMNDIDGPEDDSIHLCEDLRSLLPRMHHVHIDMSSLCDALFGTWDSDECFHPTALPNLRSLHIPCVGMQNKTPCLERHRQDQWSLWNSIIPALQLVVELPDTADADITVLGSVAPLSSYKLDIYTTLLRCHIKRGRTTTWAFPTTKHLVKEEIEGERWKMQLVYIRLYHETYMTQRKWIYMLAGGRPWRILNSGSRLPVPWSNSAEWMPDEKLGIMTWEKWTKGNPGEVPMLLKNEEVAGMRLIDAEEREGHEEVCLAEKTPAGFVRPSRWSRSQLFRAD
ncbi:uncharacterized protein BKA55DRAFT_559270 [Fusarium redolens]|uniref:F-box domain-containing protein n=1 Tax=Fusarium redolens TaxID=48865 RepID=A0A9P9HXZ7_FUSRE|nr:uncharacterized protein BKA55DRAFT_559270 [Fusarium redolens]KAH7265607.1 hypothetical protein BKA55DRAFT_559270 [Fusarium redolens]